MKGSNVEYTIRTIGEPDRGVKLEGGDAHATVSVGTLEDGIESVVLNRAQALALARALDAIAKRLARK